jgi:hypothetical protein
MPSLIRMRTTLNIEEEILDTCKDLADQQGLSLGDAVGLLIRRGLAYRSPCRERNGFVVFEASPGQRTFGLEEVKKAMAEEDAGYAAGFFKSPS